MPEPAAGGGYGAIIAGAALVSAGWARDFVRVAGPDAERYLQGQLSQDVAQLAPGGTAWSLVLQPQGKLDVFVRCTRLGDNEFVLDSDRGMGATLVHRLLRFRLRTKADVDQLDWQVLAVRGPLAPAPAGLAIPFRWSGLVGYDLAGEAPQLPEPLATATAEDHEAARIEAGFPRHGAELDERTIPAEAGLVEATVSFTKGCYTGQELVARIDSRGSNVPRRLRGLLLSGPAAPGTPLFNSDDGKEVGRLTSMARSPARGWVGLGYASRAVEPGAGLVVGDGLASAVVHRLPLFAAAS